MTFVASVDSLLEEAPDFSNALDAQTQPIFLGLALASWVFGEALMAPVLHPFLLWLWLGYVACFFIFTVWYFRVSRLLNAAWTSYKQALSPMIWTLGPLHVICPAALLLMHAGLVGMLTYEMIKAGVILAVLSRLARVFQVLNQWPRWSALALVLSPLAVAFVGIIVLVTIGMLAMAALALKAVLPYSI